MAAGIVRESVRGRWHYVLWLFGATGLLHAGAYMLISRVFNRSGSRCWALAPILASFG